jgi:hypothetical protein
MTGTQAAQPSSESSPSAKAGSTAPQGSRAKRALTGFLATIVTIYGILTAVVIFSASRAESLYYDNVFLSQSMLSDASELALAAHIEASHDLSVLQQMEVHELTGADPMINEQLYGYLSAEAQASVERSGGIDDAYVEEKYFAHSVERDNAMRSFDLAVAWSERSSTYETLATILAVGLAFAAWASLMEQGGFIRLVFAVVSTLVLMASLGYLGIHLVTREPLEDYVDYVDYEDHAPAGELDASLADGSYVHPSGAFAFAVPSGWDLMQEDEVSSFITDGESLAGAEFAEVAAAFTEDEMQAHAADYIGALLGDYQVVTLDARPGAVQAIVTYTYEDAPSRASFLFVQENTVVFALFFATASDVHDERQPTWDEIRDSFQSNPEAALAAGP